MIQKRKMTFTPLKEKDMALYVGPNHPYYEKEYVTKEELKANGRCYIAEEGTCLK